VHNAFGAIYDAFAAADAEITMYMYNALRVCEFPCPTAATCPWLKAGHLV
jgi:hypothetical protein